MQETSQHGVPLPPKRILILGGGFGGVRTALDLAEYDLPNIKITLISDKHHFEYTPSLYKIATGHSPAETCIPLGEIFSHMKKKKFEFVVDTIVGGSLSEKYVTGASGSRYSYDYVVLGLGAETAYFGISGIKENSYAIKSVSSALKLKNHLHYLFNNHHKLSKGDLMSQFQFVIVGGGPAGVELAGEIRRYGRKLAGVHGVPKKLVTVDIIQAAPRLLPTMPEEVSRRALNRLNDLGVNIILNRSVSSEDMQGVYLKDIKFNAKTIVWTAGVRPSSIYEKISGLTLEKGGRIVVDDKMRVPEFPNAFALGDSASTPNAGTAQTATHDGEFVAHAIARTIQGHRVPKYTSHKSAYVVPIGQEWAVFTINKFVFSGEIFWWLRRFIDLKFLFTILPIRKAFTAWRSGGILSESCPTCLQAQDESEEKPLFFRH
ncbi:MAG: NAD(P)/FAD-dependent oxidoreductase [Candidatus Pacebacteria bacterium]|nr:NAD(P)/FAD-dependent oxidoreductase [Candidatus Paceibacterota bacterium]